MILTLDGQRVAEPGVASETLQGLLDQVRAMHLKDRMILSVAINGQRLAETDLNSGLAQPVADDAQVDLESGEPIALVRTVLRQLAAEFVEAGGQLGGIADRLNSADTAAAIRDVGKFVGLWQTSYRALAQCGELIRRDLTGYECAGRTVKTGLTEVVEKLSELRGALEARDIVLLADLVRYELPPLTQAWSETLSNLADQVRIDSSGD